VRIVRDLYAHCGQNAELATVDAGGANSALYLWHRVLPNPSSRRVIMFVWWHWHGCCCCCCCRVLLYRQGVVTSEGYIGCEAAAVGLKRLRHFEGSKTGPEAGSWWHPLASVRRCVAPLRLISAGTN
jgi:hypothetical protein